MRLHTIISGGQNGADIAGVKAAKECGFKTGGWMPFGWKTLDGPRPEYAELYGMKQCQSHGYPARTRLNVLDADATIVIADDFKSPGTVLTVNEVKRQKKFYYSIGLEVSRDDHFRREVVAFITNTGAGVLNIAGNSERRGRPAIEPVVFAFMCDVLQMLKEGSA